MKKKMVTDVKKVSAILGMSEDRILLAIAAIITKYPDSMDDFDLITYNGEDMMIISEGGVLLLIDYLLTVTRIDQLIDLYGDMSRGA